MRIPLRHNSTWAPERTTGYVAERHRRPWADVRYPPLCASVLHRLADAQGAQNKTFCGLSDPLQIVKIAGYAPAAPTGWPARLWAVWSSNPGPQELPDLLGGLGCLRGAEHALVDVGQVLADLQGDLDPGFGCCSGQAFGIAEQQLGRACLHQQWREPGQGGEQRRRQGRCRG